ncbi:hypothetical protein ABFS82_03G009800 [Erythranthe guttata]
MGSRAGYEYRYGFAAAYGGVLPLKTFGWRKKLFFEIRTNFILRKRISKEEEEVIIGSERFEEVIIGSERFDMILGDDFEDPTYLILWIKPRLKSYWIIPSDEIDLLLSGAFDFAKQCSSNDNDNLVIPAVVNLEICTVQIEGESIDDAFDRAISGECLEPIFLMLNFSGRNDEINKLVPSELQRFLNTRLDKVRVEDLDEGLSLMNECSICLRSPIVGSRISVLPNCGHAFHSHCIVRWFILSNLCPLCSCPGHYFPVSQDFPYLSSY